MLWNQKSYDVQPEDAAEEEESNLSLPRGYMTKTIKEYTGEKVAAAAKAKSQDLVPGAVKPVTDVAETEDSKNATIATKFFQALASGGQGMAKAQKSIREQYTAKSQSIAVQ